MPGKRKSVFALPVGSPLFFPSDGFPWRGHTLSTDGMGFSFRERFSGVRALRPDRLSRRSSRSAVRLRHEAGLVRFRERRGGTPFPAEAERRRSSRLRRVWLRHASLRVSRDILHAGRTSRFFGYERVRGASGMFFPLFQKIRRSGSGSAQSVRFQKVLTRYVSMIWNLSIHNMGFPGTFKNRKAPLPASFPFPAFFPLFRFFCWDSFRFFPFRFHSIDSCVRRLRQTPFFQASRRRAWRFSLPVLAHTL